MANRTPQLILLPGFGADDRLLEPQRRDFPQLVVPRWIPPRKKEPLAAYAARMAEVLKPSPVPLVLGGVSFGGMLAYEMARHLKPEAVVLIASCRNRRGLRWLYRAGRPLWPLVPAWTWDIAKSFSRPSVLFSSRMSAGERELLNQMFREADNRFMHWTVHAILGWKPSPLEGVRVFQIHGRRDRLIPPWRVEADVWVPDGGHLINVAHARAVNAFIRSVLESCG
jgi:pimeloyl-ACP methyl ester carboxylesterase